MSAFAASAPVAPAAPRRRRAIIVGLGTLAASAALAVGSGANFSSASANPSNVFAAGTLAHSNSKDGAAVLSISQMRPGDSATGQVTITNTGDVNGTFTLAMSKLTDTAGPNGGKLSSKLDVVITDTTTSTVVYTGKLDAFTSKALGTYTPNAAHTYKVVATFPDGGQPASATTGDNAYQASSTSVELDFNVVQ